MKKASAIIATMMAIVFLFAACGDASTTSPSPEVNPSAEVSAAPEDTTTPEESAAPEDTTAPEESDVPEVTDGTLQGTGYTVAVPEGWTILSDVTDKFSFQSGTLADISVAVVALAPAAGTELTEEFISQQISQVAPGMTVESFTDSSVSGKDAKKMVISAEIAGVATTIDAYYVPLGDNILSVTFTVLGSADTSLNDALLNGIVIE